MNARILKRQENSIINILAIHSLSDVIMKMYIQYNLVFLSWKFAKPGLYKVLGYFLPSSVKGSIQLAVYTC